MLKTKEEIEHQIQRTINYLQSVVVDPEEKTLLSADMENVGSYFRLLSENLLEIPGGSTYGQLETNLDGKPLPARPLFTMPTITEHSPPYGLVLNNAVGTGTFSGMRSAGVLMTGDSECHDFLIYGSGGDAFKVDWGGHIIRRGHLFGLGLSVGAHADGAQSRGGLTSLLVEDTFFDIPTNEMLSTTKSNACLIVDSSQAAHEGDIVFNNTILRGGNRVFMLGDKGTGNRMPLHDINNSAIIAELDSPRFTIMQPGLEDYYTFNNCNIYSLENGICKYVTNQIKQFNMDAWHQAKYSRKTLR